MIYVLENTHSAQFPGVLILAHLHIMIRDDAAVIATGPVCPGLSLARLAIHASLQKESLSAPFAVHYRWFTFVECLDKLWIVQGIYLKLGRRICIRKGSAVTQGGKGLFIIVKGALLRIVPNTKV